MQPNQPQPDSTNSSKNIIYIYFINYKIKTIIAHHHLIIIVFKTASKTLPSHFSRGIPWSA